MNKQMKKRNIFLGNVPEKDVYHQQIYNFEEL